MIATDFVTPFQVERVGVRGRILRLGPLLNQILGSHGYPGPVAVLLAETIALTGLLGSTLKYDGVFTLQAKGDGPIRMIVVDLTSTGDIRAYAQFDDDAIDGLGSDTPSVPALLGQGHLAFTADRGPEQDRYQGIVELVGATLTECVHHYFRHSEQIDAAIKVAITEESTKGTNGSAGWQTGAIMVQRLPGEAPHSEIALAEDEDGWREAVALMASVKDAELTDPRLTPDRLLYRLFHEPGVRMFAPRGLAPGCRCSRARVAGTLGAFPKAEVLDLMERGIVSVKCEFCGAAYEFDAPALEALYA
jgi:molecular chaperone Hsp33